MAFLKFNKSELVNLEYSLKRELIVANETGAYCNTSIVTCNTRRYHGLLAVPVEELGGGKYMLLSSLDEKTRVVFMRRYWYMMPIAKIAFMSGMSESNVKTTLHRTRAAFREHLEKEGITV